jgi:hypothetical protein
MLTEGTRTVVNRESPVVLTGTNLPDEEARRACREARQASLDDLERGLEE